MSIILRILSGVHKDAKIELSPGDWEIGSDALCDILLNDVARHQATLKVYDDTKIMLIPKQEAEIVDNYIQGQLVPAEGVEVALYTCISFGQVHAALGAAEINQWPSISIPTMQEMENHSNTIETAENIANEQVSNQSQTLSLNGDNLTINTKNGLKAKSIAQRILLFFLLIALCVGGISSLTGPSKAELQRQDIEAVLNSLDALDLTIKEDNDFVWHVSGGVKDSQIQEQLEQALKGLPFEVKTEFISLADIAQSLETRIKAEGSLLRVQVLSSGLSIAGYIYDDKNLQSLLAPMQDALDKINFNKNITYYNKIKDNLQASLAALGLQSVIHLTPGPYAILIENSALSPEQKKNLGIFVQEVVGMTRGVMPFVKPKPVQTSNSSEPKSLNQTHAVQEKEFCSSLEIGSQGSKMYVIYQDNHYNQGARLPNGFVVQEVRETYSTFVKNDLLVYCPR